MYGILRRLTGLRLVAAAFSCLLIFDNALVVHSRAAMLEGIQIFFILAAIYYLVRTLTNDIAIRLRQYAILGVLVGLAVSVKANAAVLLLLLDRKSTRLNSSHVANSYAVFCLQKK